MIAEVSIDSPNAEGVLFKHGGAHGGHVLFVQHGRLHYVYNFLGEQEQKLSSNAAVPQGKHIFGLAYNRTGIVAGSHTPLGEATLYIDDTVVATMPEMKTHPIMFGLAGASVSIGRNAGSPVSNAYTPPFAFTGGTIAHVTVDISGRPYVDLEKAFAAIFARD